MGKIVTGETTILTNYIGQGKNVVIPLSGDLGTTNVKITKTALRAAAMSANTHGGTLVNSGNDTVGTGLISDNSTDDNPNDTIVNYSETFKDLNKITKINLSQLKINAQNGENGQDVKGENGTSSDLNGKDRRGTDGKPGESIDVSSMFENCTSLKEVDLSSFVGQGGNGYGGTGVNGGSGYGGTGGNAGNFTSKNMFENTLQLSNIQLMNFIGHSGNGGKGGTGTGGNGQGGRGGSGYGGIHGKSGSSLKVNMFFPIAVNKLDVSKNIGFAPEELKANVTALRSTDLGKGENLLDTELAKVAVSAKDEGGNAVDLSDVSENVGQYTITYAYKGKEISTNLIVTLQNGTQGTLDKEDEQLKQQQEAQAAVDKLFYNNDQLDSSVVLETIQAAQTLIDKVTDENKKQELQNKLNKAQTLYNHQKLLAEVTVMVNGLFTDDSHTALKEGVTTEDIEKALGALKQLPDSSELMKLINKAYDLLENKSFTITNIDSYEEGKDNWITGKYEGVAPGYIRATVNGAKKPLVPFKATTDRTFKYYLPGLKATDKVEVETFDKEYKKLNQMAVPFK